MQTFKVLLAAKWIPDGTTVTKFTKNGYELRLKRSLRIFSDEPAARQELKTEGMAFLIALEGGVGNITAISDDTELLAILTAAQLETIAENKAFAEETHQ